ncbi:MAG: DUF523 domain-containing protein [Gammaproteobacteria bacterium]|nr:DUF523 domain-containing protein [Gammaproteobacteria bacterium]
MSLDTPFPDFLFAAKPVLGISACLLGQAVRYDGGQKRDAWLVESLGERVDFVPVCPEVAIGLGIPREPIQLVDVGTGIRALGVRHSDVDVTDALRVYGEKAVADLPRISGYVFKKGSPSCGLEGVSLYTPGGRLLGGGTRGLYAEAFARLRPELPMEEEGGLADPRLRENFLLRVWLFTGWQDMLGAGLCADALEAFQAWASGVLTRLEPERGPAVALAAQAEALRAERLPVVAQCYIAELMVGLRRLAPAAVASPVRGFPLPTSVKRHPGSVGRQTIDKR